MMIELCWNSELSGPTEARHVSRMLAAYADSVDEIKAARAAADIARDDADRNAKLDKALSGLAAADAKPAAKPDSARDAFACGLYDENDAARAAFVCGIFDKLNAARDAEAAARDASDEAAELGGFSFDDRVEYVVGDDGHGYEVRIMRWVQPNKPQNAQTEPTKTND